MPHKIDDIQLCWIIKIWGRLMLQLFTSFSFTVKIKPAFKDRLISWVDSKSNIVYLSSMTVYFQDRFL